MTAQFFVFTLYTVPKAPEPIIPPRLISDSLISLSLERSGLALVGVRGCKIEINTVKTLKIRTHKKLLKIC